MLRQPAPGVSAMVLLVLSSACGGSPLTSARIGQAVAPTFANLVHLQVSSMGLAPISTQELAASARCRKVGAPGAPETHTGSGDWVCTIDWQGPDRRVLRDIYDLSVTTDGCYTATAEGEGLGRPMLTTKDGREVRNLLYIFEGCFNTT